MWPGACFLACLGVQHASAQESESPAAEAPNDVSEQAAPEQVEDTSLESAPEPPGSPRAPAQAWDIVSGEGRVTVLLTTRGYLAPLAHHHVLTFPAVRGGGSLDEETCDFQVEVDTRVMRVDDPDDRMRHGLPGTIGPRQRRRVERRVREVVLRSSDHGTIRFIASRCHDAMGTFDGALEITDQLAPISGRAGVSLLPTPRLVATTSVRLHTYDLPSAGRWLGLILPEPALPVVIELPLKEG